MIIDDLIACLSNHNEQQWNADLAHITITCDPHNRRLKCLGLLPDDLDTSAYTHLLTTLRQHQPDISKLLIYLRAPSLPAWAGDLVHEACLSGFFAGTDAQVLAAFLDPERAVASNDAELTAIRSAAEARSPAPAPLAEGYQARSAQADDLDLLIDLLRRTFPDYPTPIDPDYLGPRLAEGSSLFEIIDDAQGQPVAIISAEVDLTNRNAEISDCATLPAHRGRGLMRHLITRAEQAATARGVTACYTLARACEPGVNHAFAGCGYRYTGRLVNNCRMPTGWETMNAWCRPT